MRRPPFRGVAAAALLAIAGAGWYAVSLRNRAAQGPARIPAPLEFTFGDAEGGEVRLADIGGAPIIVYVWASWCPRCREGLEDLAALRREFGEAVRIVALNRAESMETTARFRGISGTATGTIFLSDPDDAYYRAIGGFAMPETLFVDRGGMIRFHKRGPMEREEFRRRIEELLH